MKRVQSILFGFAISLVCAVPVFAGNNGNTAITVSSSAGGTLVVPAGIAQNQLYITNTGGSNAMYCSYGQTPSATNFNFTVATGTMYSVTSLRANPEVIGSNGGLLMGDAITCIGIGGSTTATYYKR